jgi:hypothetical protein
VSESIYVFQQLGCLTKDEKLSDKKARNDINILVPEEV